MIVDSQTHCQIDYIPEMRCIIQTWQGYARSDRFRDSIEKTIAYAQSHEVRSIISDTREQKLVGVEDIKWLATEGNPRLYQAGIRKLAFIAPRDQMTKMGESDYASRSKDQIIVQWFVGLEQAKAWAEEV
jgi:hypothetical protein